MDSTWIVQIDPRFIPRELFGTMGKCSLSPNCCTPLKIQLISLLPFIRVWVITVTHTAFSLLGARSIFISTLYLTFILPSFFHFWVMSTLRFFQTKSLLARLEGRLTKVDSESRLSIPSLINLGSEDIQNSSSNPKLQVSWTVRVYFLRSRSNSSMLLVLASWSTRIGRQQAFYIFNGWTTSSVVQPDFHSGVICTQYFKKLQ